MKRKSAALIPALALLLTAFFMLSASASSQPVTDRASLDVYGGSTVPASKAAARYYYDRQEGVRMAVDSGALLPESAYITASVITAGDIYEKAASVADGKDFMLYDLYVMCADGTAYTADIQCELALPLSERFERGFCSVFCLDELGGKVSSPIVSCEDVFAVFGCSGTGLYMLVSTREKGINGGLGDIDFDGRISSSDARLALRMAVGLQDYLSVEAKKNADVDEDGNVTAADARHILRYSVGLV